MILYEGLNVTINVGTVKSVQILDVLSTGGFGNIFKVKDTVSGKLYALKHIQVEPKLKGKEKEVFIQRVKNAGGIKIPSRYIIQNIGVNEFEKDNFAILFEFFERTKDFGDWIFDNKAKTWAEKQTLFIKILKGVQDVHSTNIIHRDLKPNNILITEDNEPKIIGFAFAKFKDKSVTLTGDFFGTLPYLDPSALLNGSKYVDARCDIYAMGVILHQLICGSHYWTAAEIEFSQLVKIITTGKAKNIMEIEEVKTSFAGDETLKNIIAKATMFDPESRISSINEMITLLGDKLIEKVYPKVDFETTTAALYAENGSAKGTMYPIGIRNGQTRELNRTNLDVNNHKISRKKHAFIECKGNQYYIYEGDGTEGTGTNGTFLNGTRLKIGKENKVEIKHTDRIRFADMWTRFVFLKS